MQDLYRIIRPILVVLCAIYITLVSYLLVKWAPIGFDGLERHGFVVALIFITVAMWIYTIYEAWKSATESKLNFAEFITMIFERIAGHNRPTNVS